MVAHVCRYLLAEDVRGVIVTLTPAISHDVVSILQVPPHRPGCWNTRSSHHISVAILAQSLRFCFQHATGYSFMLCSWAYCQVCTVCSAFPLIQLQCVHSQQLACCLVLGYEHCHTAYDLGKSLQRYVLSRCIDTQFCPVLVSRFEQSIELFDRHFCLFICLNDNISLHIFYAVVAKRSFALPMRHRMAALRYKILGRKALNLACAPDD